MSAAKAARPRPTKRGEAAAGGGVRAPRKTGGPERKTASAPGKAGGAARKAAGAPGKAGGAARKAAGAPGRAGGAARKAAGAPGKAGGAARKAAGAPGKATVAAGRAGGAARKTVAPAARTAAGATRRGAEAPGKGRVAARQGGRDATEEREDSAAAPDDGALDEEALAAAEEEALDDAPPPPSPSFGIVALVGRPNTGKSTLFNRLVGRRVAIVHDEPGVTRDRHYADVTSRGRRFTLVDTGGFDPESDDPMRQGIKRQIDLAIAEADVIVCVLDAVTPVTPSEHAELGLLRRAGKPVIYVANKADSSRAEAEAAELYRLGMERLIPISALHGRGISELEMAIEAALPKEPVAPEASTEGALRVAIVGRPNAGKSSLVNRITGEERMLVDAQPGTTRDPIDTLTERDGKRLLLIDTAGIRRKSKVTKEDSAVEAVSVLHAIRAMERAEIVVLLCDAAEGVAEQDAKILGLAVDRGRAIVIGLNKADLLDRKALTKAEEDARDKLSFVPWAPVVQVSARSGRGVSKLVETVTRVADAYRRRVPTGELNRFFEQILLTHPPPTQGGRAPRLFFVTQAETSPPLFVVVASDPEKLHFSYRRYVANQLRQTFGLEGVPVRVKYKERRRRG
ncbi:ribosome-associated GTPase EngA [Sorangium cellulosum]|uniref:GTPase Der n=1 Tax=Sorangium cellulosum TaxID=56 RepID=A0A2L0F2M9_SORCE|nr:ribosome biogenesis GTPase Der [Sorangium cellulosum]AUX45761.1 ribosome-associated GTPase EngA [Sorangium cellulosum]